MATLHQATIEPSKPQVLAEFLSSVDAWDVPAGTSVSRIGSYRFDDPTGEVGIETTLLTTSDGRTFQVPLTYRAEPLAGADDFFVAQVEHSALGTRFFYDACGDPVYVAELLRTIVEADSQVELEVVTPEGSIRRDNDVFVRGSGAAAAGADLGAPYVERDGTDSRITAAGLTIVVHHLPQPGTTPATPHLAGTWAGVDTPTTLATIFG